MLNNVREKIQETCSSVSNGTKKFWQRHKADILIIVGGAISLFTAGAFGYAIGHTKGEVNGYYSGISDCAKVSYELTKIADPEVANKVFGDPSTWTEI